jgi:hypothetical protein
VCMYILASCGSDFGEYCVIPACRVASHIVLYITMSSRLTVQKGCISNEIFYVYDSRDNHFCLVTRYTICAALPFADRDQCLDTLPPIRCPCLPIWY